MIAYIDIISGISGDMFLAALIDAGFSAKKLLDELKKLNINFDMEVKKEGDVIKGTSVYIYSRDDKRRGLNDILSMIENSDLSENVKERAKKIFTNIANVEAKIHGIDVEEVHFHELGAVDTIVDIVGSLIALEGLGISKIYSSPVKVGRGIVECMHGKLPVPAPATLELLKGKPIEFTDIDAEITTPTGAALLRMAEFCYPEIEVDRVGYGLGKKKLDIPNLLRIVIGREVDAGGVYVIETNIDDMNPELYPHVISNLIDAGALDAFIIPVVMKKNRGGVLLKVIATGNKLEEIKKIIYEETTTFGCRYYKVVRDKLEREIVEVETEYGKIRVKVGYFNGKIITISPEYEDCAKVAKESRVPIREVYEKAREKARKIIS